MDWEDFQNDHHRLHSLVVSIEATEPKQALVKAELDRLIVESNRELRRQDGGRDHLHRIRERYRCQPVGRFIAGRANHLRFRVGFKIVCKN